MHVFDIICAGLACIFVFVGIYRGFVEEMIRLVAVVAAFFAGLSLYRPAAAHLQFLHLSGAVLSVTAFLAIFLVFVVAIVLLGILVKKVIHLTILAWADRLCGGILGFAKIFLLTWITVITISSLPFDKVKNWFRPAKAYAFFAVISPRLRAGGLIPATGPVQNILKANPIPAMKGALENVAAKDTAPAKTGRGPEKAQPAAAKPSTSTGAK